MEAAGARIDLDGGGGGGGGAAAAAKAKAETKMEESVLSATTTTTTSDAALYKGNGGAALKKWNKRTIAERVVRRHAASVKIQAMVRGYLTRMRMGLL